MPPAAEYFSTNPNLIDERFALQELHEAVCDQGRPLRVRVNSVVIEAHGIRPCNSEAPPHINKVD